MYVYLARGSAEVGTGAKDFYDFIEFNIGRSSSDLPYNFNGDTTRVDAFGLKLAFRLQCADGTLVTRGEDYGTFLERRAITFQKYAAELGQPFAAASTTFAPYRIAEPGTSGFGAGGPYANYEKAYVDAVYANNGIDPAVVAKPTPFINLSAQLPDLSAAIERHVAETPGTFKSDGTLVDPDFWRKTDRRRFYAAVPANMYARYWHEHAIGGYQYGFPYDDVGGYSSDVSCNGAAEPGRSGRLVAPAEPPGTGLSGRGTKKKGSAPSTSSGGHPSRRVGMGPASPRWSPPSFD